MSRYSQFLIAEQLLAANISSGFELAGYTALILGAGPILPFGHIS